MSSTKEAIAAKVSAESKKPIGVILYQCRRAFYFAFLMTLVIDLLSIAPILYMMNVYDG